MYITGYIIILDRIEICNITDNISLKENQKIVSIIEEIELVQVRLWVVGFPELNYISG